MAVGHCGFDDGRADAGMLGGSLLRGGFSPAGLLLLGDWGVASGWEDLDNLRFMSSVCLAGEESLEAGPAAGVERGSG